MPEVLITNCLRQRPEEASRERLLIHDAWRCAAG